MRKSYSRSQEVTWLTASSGSHPELNLWSRSRVDTRYTAIKCSGNLLPPHKIKNNYRSFLGPDGFVAGKKEKGERGDFLKPCLLSFFGPFVFVPSSKFIHHSDPARPPPPGLLFQIWDPILHGFHRKREGAAFFKPFLCLHECMAFPFQ